MTTKSVLTDREWVAYYMKNPRALLAFIQTANEQANRMADDLARLQAERDAANALLRDVISEVEEYQKLPLTDRLQRQLLAYKSALRGVEQRAEE